MRHKTHIDARWKRDFGAVQLPKGRPLFLTTPGEPIREYFAYIPETSEAKRLVVLMHGISENACEQIIRFAVPAEHAGAVLIAPLMRRSNFGQYQQLIDPLRGIRSDLALNDILNAVRQATELADLPFDIFGFSGGGQFAHRYALLHPSAVRSCVVVAPGWFTFPDEKKRYPNGLTDIPVSLPSFDGAAARRIPFHVLVGSRDTVRDASLRRSADLDRHQGRTRLERAIRWYEAMQNWGADNRSSLTVLPQLRHSFSEAVRDHNLPDLAFTLFQ